MPDSPITFENVELLRHSSLGDWYRIDGREVFIGSSVPLQGTTIHSQGDHGRLVLPRWFVQTEGLPESLN